MRKAMVLYKDEPAGMLVQQDDGSFVFNYTHEWMTDPSKPPISLTFPKSQQTFRSDYLFPFFYHLLPEGTNRRIVSRHLRIDQNDDFGLLLHTARFDTIGAVTIVKTE